MIHEAIRPWTEGEEREEEGWDGEEREGRRRETGRERRTEGRWKEKERMDQKKVGGLRRLTNDLGRDGEIIYIYSKMKATFKSQRVRISL